MRFLISILLSILLANPAWAAITQVQDASTAELTGTDATISVSISAASANNLLVTALAVDKSSGAITVPTGFTLINDNVAASVSCAVAYKIASGGETSVVWNWTTNQLASAWVGEYSGTATSSVFDVATENATESVVTSLSTGTTGTTNQADEIAIAYMSCDSTGNCNDSRTWSNSFTEVEFAGQTSVGTPGLSVATKTLSSTGTQEATYSVTDTGDQMCGGIQTFKALISLEMLKANTDLSINTDLKIQ